MKKFNLPTFFDSGLLTLIIFGISLLLLSPLKIHFAFKIILSILIASFVLTLFLFFNEKNLGKNNIKKEKEKKIKKLGEILEVSADNSVIALLIDLLGCFSIIPQKKKNHLESDDIFFFFDFNLSTKRETLSSFLKTAKDKKIVVFVNSLDDESKKLEILNKERLFVVDISSLYFMLEDKNLIKNHKFLDDLNKKEKKITFDKKLKTIFPNFLTKKRARTFAITGLVLLLFSSITFYPVYYRICSLICLLTALCLIIFGKKSTVKTTTSIEEFINNKQGN